MMRAVAAVGLHARPAALFCQAVLACRAPVSIGRPGLPAVDAASIVSVLSLDIVAGEEVVLTSTSSDALARLAALDGIFQ